MFDDIFSTDDMIDMQRILKEYNMTITSAESCTGGLISSMITEIPGSSDIFKGSIITYCNEIKEQELDVKKETMIEYGVVSTQVVEQMCIGALKKFNANFAMAVSGVAGPGGGTITKPVGTVCFAIASKDKEIISKKINLTGTRKSIQIESSKIILKEIYKFIQKTLDK